MQFWQYTVQCKMSKSTNVSQIIAPALKVSEFQSFYLQKVGEGHEVQAIAILWQLSKFTI